MTRLVATCAAAAAAAAGCGGEDSDPATGAAPTDLTVRFEHPHKPELSYRCSPRPDAGPERCDPLTLAQIRGALRKRSRRDVACTEIYGGPQRATLTGTLRGKRISATFTRADGCAIAAYDALLRAFGTDTRAGTAADEGDVAVPEHDASPPAARIVLFAERGGPALGQAAQPPGGSSPPVVKLRAPRLLGTTFGLDRDGGIARVRVSVTERITCRAPGGRLFERRRVRYFPPPQIERIRSTPGALLPATAMRSVPLALGRRRCGPRARVDRVHGELWGEAINGSGLESVTPHIPFVFDARRGSGR
jgi:hypothetical protein